MQSLQGSTRQGFTSRPTNVAVDRPPVLKEHQLLATWTSPQGYSQHSNLLPSEWGQRRGGKSEQGGERRQARRKSVLEMTSQHFWHFVFIRSESLGPLHIQGRFHRGHAYQEMEITGVHFRSAYYAEQGRGDIVILIRLRRTEKAQVWRSFVLDGEFKRTRCL